MLSNTPGFTLLAYSHLFGITFLSKDDPDRRSSFFSMTFFPGSDYASVAQNTQGQEMAGSCFGSYFEETLYSLGWSVVRLLTPIIRRGV